MIIKSQELFYKRLKVLLSLMNKTTLLQTQVQENDCDRPTKIPFRVEV